MYWGNWWFHVIYVALIIPIFIGMVWGLVLGMLGLKTPWPALLTFLAAVAALVVCLRFKLYDFDKWHWRNIEDQRMKVGYILLYAMLAVAGVLVVGAMLFAKEQVS